MKAKCPICTKAKGRRNCQLKDNALICSLCCANIRSADSCSDCSHFSASQKQEYQKTINKEGVYFIPTLNADVEELVYEALSLLEKGDVSKAEEILSPLLEQYPHNHMTQYGISCIYTTRDEHFKAIKHLSKAVEISPCFTEAWHNLGSSYRETYDIPRTLICARKVIEFSEPGDICAKAWKTLMKDLSDNFAKQGLTIDTYISNAKEFETAFSHMENGDYIEAIRRFQKVLILDKTHVQSHGNLALCYAFLGDKQTALNHIDKALEIDPNYDVARSNRPMIEALKDGEKLEQNIQTVEFYSTGMTPRTD